MALMIDLAPEQESVLRQVAATQGIAPEMYALWLVQSGLPMPTACEPIRPSGTPEERLVAYRSWAITRNSSIAAPSTDAYDRENLYEDRF